MGSAEEIFTKYPEDVVQGNHAASNYLGLIKRLVSIATPLPEETKKEIQAMYDLLLDEIRTSDLTPTKEVSFGTSGWRGFLGKDITVRTVAQVTTAIVEMYQSIDQDSTLADLLGVSSFAEVQKRGCVLGFDNRFAGPVFAGVVAGVLSEAGIFVHYAGESTTGVLSAAVLQKKSAFSINLTPSHNPLDYAGYKFNAADGGPAEGAVTAKITDIARRIVSDESGRKSGCIPACMDTYDRENVKAFDSLECWLQLVEENEAVHGIQKTAVLDRFASAKDISVIIDCVHGASRLHIKRMLGDASGANLTMLRDWEDVTFGGVAPEPSTENMAGVVERLQQCGTTLKLGAIIDPDGDRIRFTDGTTEISMNQFGAMAYHYLHEYKNIKGMVAKTVATSNLANAVAEKLGEEVFEPAVGFKNFKPVIGRAVVIFEESDGISIIGHTPEKDAYVGLLLALDMVVTTGKNLGDYLREIETAFGSYYPDRDGIVVTIQGEELMHMLANLEKYGVGAEVHVGGSLKKITEVITLDGRKMILDDGSWLMIRPSGTEPKVRFYVESRTKQGTSDLVDTAKTMLREIGVLQ